MTTLIPWLAAPNWAEGITETLEWKTSILQSSSGAEQRVARRLSPRRSYELSVITAGNDRAAFENALARAGGMTWTIPAWPDIAELAVTCPVGSLIIPVITTGRNFTAGGKLLIQSAQGWLSRYEVADIRLVMSDRLVLASGTAQQWSAGTLIYPAYQAFLTNPPAISRKTDALMSARVRFQVMGANDYPAVNNLPLYRSHPILEHDPDWSDELTAEYNRMMLELDNGTGIPFRTDTAQRAFTVQQHVWVAAGRYVQGALRSLFWYLRGSQRSLWIRSQSNDLEPISPLNGNILDVQFVGLSDFGLMPGRQDIAIRLADGAYLYRRITAVNRRTSISDRLILDGAPVQVPLSHIVSISFMSLCRQNSDSVDWEHQTDADGVATISTTFRGVRDELE
ncbi:phage tail protein [Budviciaceae bacterium CWB-B4]|uniref:Phage tail protein n=1 Tax=Limnobaculum xujianqingii TaxID=2738837 RepID=A0A9D7AH83_9GAMM|nr:hypothetical protein [Limnobaculum xujianqingii]MBK5072578.1 phage tail protein [Limnobaculum xujianqingii]MBK5175887.1 phage tail protein [Limnobaculum xujianqingii]